MNIKQYVKANWIELKRNKLFLTFCFFNYLFLALVDNKSFLLLDNYEMFIYRFVFQQLFIVVTSMFGVGILLSEKVLRSIREYMIIYAKSVSFDIYLRLGITCFVNIVFFILGQLLLLVLNIVNSKEFFFSLWATNIGIVSLEIIVCTLFIMGLRLLLRKDIIVFPLFLVYILWSITKNNVFYSLPLTMNIVGITEQRYYVMLGKELWIGRFILLIIGGIFFKIGLEKFKVSCTKEL